MNAGNWIREHAGSTASPIFRLRFLARIFSKGPKAAYPWVLKGGYAMELRMHSARTTKDIDMTLHEGTRLPKKCARAG